MGQHGNRDQKSDAPTFVCESSTGKSGVQQYGNTIFGVSPAEATVLNGMGSPGWVKIKQGLGQLANVSITTPGSGYANTDTFKVVAHQGANATGTISTAANGAITGVAITVGGGLFRANPNVSITTSGGTLGVLKGNPTGRAGRLQFETMIATRSIITDSTSFSDANTANVANSSGTTDDFLLPDA